MTRRFIFALLATIGGISLSSCGGGGGGGGTNIVSTAVGNWRQVEISSGSQTATCPGSVLDGNGDPTSCGGNDTITFRSNGTFSGVLSDDGTVVSGTWTISNDTLTLHLTAPSNVAGQSAAIVIEFQGNNTMLFKQLVGGVLGIDKYARQ